MSDNGSPAAAGPDATAVAAFLAAVVLAGGNAPAIRYVSCKSCELEPFWGAGIRFLFASLLFALIARGLRATMPRGKALVGAIVYGVLQFGAGFGLVSWGFVHAPAGFGQVLLASVPLLTFGLALAHRQERFRWEGLIGAALAVGGIAVVFASGRTAGIPLTSMAAVLAGALCAAEALVVIRGFPPVHPVAMNAIGMGVGTMILVALTAIFDEAFILPRAAQTLWAEVYLVLAGSVGVFWLYVLVAQRWTASAAAYQLVLIPLVTVPVSAWLQDERITWSFAAGSVLVLAGVYIGAFKRSRVSQRVPGR